MPLYPPAASGGGVNVTSGTGAPSGGNDGDWYFREDVPSLAYKKVSGSWVLYGRMPSLFRRASRLNAAPWLLNSQGAYITPTSTWAGSDIFDQSTTGLTFPGSPTKQRIVAASASAYGLFPGASGAFIKFTVKVLPGAAQTLTVALGPYIFGNPYPKIVINSSGVATLTDGVFSTTWPTTVTTSSDNTFAIRAMPGAVLLSQSGGSSLVDTEHLFASDYVAATNFDTYSIAFVVRGDGAVDLQVMEVYA